MTPRVRLYSKPGCHLCEDAVALLAQLRKRQPHTLELVDISTDSELVARYGERIPVLLIGDREYTAPLDASSIERALASAGASHASAR